MKNIFKNKKLSFIAFIYAVFLFLPTRVYAEGLWKEAVDGVVGTLAGLIVGACGWIMNKVISMVIDFAQYSNFVNNPQVVEAWKIVRDICNMFFVLILLFIAFAVILRIESYNVKKSLPKLLLMAVLINFSRTICGILIDFSQIIMLTFVDAFTAGSGNFSNVLKVNDFLSAVASEEYTSLTAQSAAMYYLVAIIFMITATVVMIAILVAFVMRIVMFWIYIVLSPLAFLLSSFSAGQKYASQFWGEFTKYLINGPVLAFFTWMSLMVLSSLDAGNLGNLGTTFSGAGVAILEGPNFAKFIMAIGMLVGGLIISAQIGGVGASWGANTVSGLKNRGISFAKGGVRKTAGLVGGGAKNIASLGVDKASIAAGIDFNVKRGWQRMQAQRASDRAQRAQNVESAVIDSANKGGRAALISHGALGWQNLMTWKNDGRKRLWRGKKGFKADQDKMDELGKRKESFMTTSENEEKRNRLNVLQQKMKDNRDKTKEAGKEVAAAQTLEEKQAAKQKYDNLLSERKDMRSEYDSLNNDIKNKVVSDGAIRRLDEQISELRSASTITGGATASAQSRAEMEGTETRKISHIENSDELGNILEEAIADGNQGLIAAVTKKMTRGGDYNEMMKKFGLGTGREGMQALAREQFMGKAGMSEQASLGLVAELGNLAKNNYQYGGYGAVKLENGKWKEASHEEAQQAQLAEMLKVQPQEFARKVNRLGLGEYTDSSHSTKNWKLSDAATAYIKMNQSSLSEEYKKTGQQNAIEHLALAVDKLEKNGVSKDEGGVIDVINTKSNEGGTDVKRTIKSIKQ